MASGPLVGGGEGSREKQRWSENKVYTRKIHNKKPISNSQPPPPLPPSQKPPVIAAPEDVQSSCHQPPPSPDPPQPPAPPSRLSAGSDDDASSLNRHPPAQLPDNSNNHQTTNGQGRLFTITNGQSCVFTLNLDSCSQDEVRGLRQRLTAELEQVRTFLKKLEPQEPQQPQLSVPLASAPAPGYTISQFSGSNDVRLTPVPPKRATVISEGIYTYPAPAAPRRQLNVSVPESTVEALEREKRTPKANQYYRNSEFLLAKDKFPPPDSHKKSKANGSKMAVQAVDKKLYGPAFRSCGSLLSKVMKHKFGWVFNTPVDVKGLGLHDYYSIIKHPMDLGTVKSRLSKNWYKTPEEFAEDVRLTFRNAMTYNPKGQDVHYMAEQLLQIFEERWPIIENEFAHLLYAPPPKKLMPIDMRTLERSDSTVHPMPVDSKPKPVNYVPHVSRPPALKKPKAKDLDKRDMTFEEKQKLSVNLQNLPTEKLENIVQIIKKRNSSLSQHDDEIEVDIDSVDAETLWELDRFVTNYKKSLSKNKRRAEIAMLKRAQAANSMQQERAPGNVVAEVPRENGTVADDKNVAPTMPVEGDNNVNNASRSSSSCSSSSDSGSSSSDSDSESSSGYGSEAGHSPRT